jgi:CRISPR-associated endonuclease Csn1
MASSLAAERVLGLDIGVASVGWSLLETVDGKPTRILGMGSRIFSPGVDGNLDAFSKGKDEPKAAARRAARLMRRQLWRRRRRLLKLQRVLVRFGLLPALEAYDPESIDRGFKSLDRELMSRDPLMKDHRGAQVFHYRLRARAADGRVEAYELGRALYHLAQHRGFLSNRKSAKKDGEEDGQVKSSISELKARMDASGAKTLGSFLATIDPEVERIRAKWLGRNEMIVPEFEAIRSEQAKHHTQIDKDAWESIRKAIFTQRPLKDQSFLIGKCSLEPTELRCPVAYPEAQEFRILQAVNHLRLTEIVGGVKQTERALDAEERAKLVAELMSSGDLTWPQAKKLLGFKSKEAEFSIERGGEKRLIGNRTQANLLVEAGVEPVWNRLSAAERVRLVDDLLEYEQEEKLSRRLVKRWGFAPAIAKQVATVALEPARLSFSLTAIERMLPFLREGKSVQEAKMAAYPEQAGADQPWDLLPPLRPNQVWREHCSGGRPYNGVEIRNPAVERSLSEVRKVVNAIIRRWGKPDVIRVELARDLKKPRQERKDATDRMRKQEKWRDEARDLMVQQGFPHIKERNQRADVEKVLLWEECGGVCPYTGKPISFEDLFGQNPRFEVEHIIPYSLCLEDGFANKTLCEVHENRNRKRRMSPHEAYYGTDQWDAILMRVQHFKGPTASKKLRLFRSVTNGFEVFGDFTQRQLNDTRYASRLAKEYVALLFGGKVDAESRQRVFVSAGGATAIVRRKLGIEGILGGGEKNRKDHRHHAIDALAIAITGPREVQAIARASEAAVARGEPSHRLKLEAPWPEFVDDAKRVVDGIVVSHRVDRRLSGPLHQGTNYSRPMRDFSGTVRDEALRHQRYPLESLGAADIKDIVDGAVRRAVESKLAQLGQTEPKIAFKGGANLPGVQRSDGRVVPIRRVRVKLRKSLDSVGDGPRKRYVAPGSNHHMVVVERRMADGSTSRELEVVTMLEAFRRKSRGEPIIQTEWGEGARLLFTIRSGEAVMLVRDGARVPALISSISAGQLELKLHQDARAATEIRKGGVSAGRIVLTPQAFVNSIDAKVVLLPTGGIRIAND